MRGHDWFNTCLPDELVVEIFRRLDFKRSRDACSLVCRRWLYLERLTRDTIRIGVTGTPEFFLRLLATRFSNVTNVHIDERPFMYLSFKLRRRRRTENSVVWSRKLHYVNDRNGSEEGGVDYQRLSDDGLAALGEGFPKLQKLSLIWCFDVTSAGLASLASKCSSLKALDLQDCCVGDQGLAAVGQCCKQLEDLNLHSCEDLTDKGLIELALGVGKSLKSLGVSACAKITDSSMEAVGTHCRSLETLALLDSEFIHNNGVLAVAEGCPDLKVLKLQCINVTDEALKVVGTSCLSLELLALYSFQICTDKGLASIGNGCKKLKNLSLNDCYYLSDKGLEEIATGCKELTHLEVNGYSHNIGTLGLESIGKYCQYLTELALLYCKRIGDAGLLQVGQGCKFLQALKLVHCSNIGDEAMCGVAIGCQNLKKLNISHCYEIGSKGIVAVGKHCKLLKDIRIQYCHRVGDEALVAIAEGCSLHYLNVSGCHQIGDAGVIAIARSCPKLCYLDVSVLQRVGDLAMVELGEHCPLLREIVLSRCNRITDVGLAHLVKRCTMLESCHMHNCFSITSAGVATVVSSCPNIKKVLVEKWKVSQRTKRRLRAGSVIPNL